MFLYNLQCQTNNKKKALDKMPCEKKENCHSWCKIRICRRLVWFLGLVEVLGWNSNEWVANPLDPGQTSALQIKTRSA